MQEEKFNDVEMQEAANLLKRLQSIMGILDRRYGYLAGDLDVLVERDVLEATNKRNVRVLEEGLKSIPWYRWKERRLVKRAIEVFSTNAIASIISLSSDTRAAVKQACNSANFIQDPFKSVKEAK